MRMKWMLAAGLTAAVLFGATLTVRADEAKTKELSDKIAAIVKDLSPLRSKAQANPEVKAAHEATVAAHEVAMAAQAKEYAALEAAMIALDPKAKDLIEERKKLQAELEAAKKAEMDAKKKPAEKK